MLFSSVIFLYYFLPLVLALYFLTPRRFRNYILLIASLFFYFYGEPIYAALMILSSMLGYLHGLWIQKAKGSRYEKIPLISSIISIIGVLLFFKYADFFIDNINWLFYSNIIPLRLALPIGISFYTFQIASYTIDVYRGEAGVQKNPFTFATYVTLFPQLIAGPIVRYKTIEDELENRTHSKENIACGINRFIIGLAKKVIIANTLGELVKIASNTGDKTIILYWVAVFAYALQIYYDFSAYSDMAIGLGRIFGFHFLENFNYPFIAKSIAEFWRRWHISLGTWFRDYVYIPLGGNRVSKLRWVRNIILVWFLTGFWHGAQWNFVVWGLYFAVLLMLEKYLKIYLEKLPSILRHIYVLFFLSISFVIFNANGMNEAVENIKGMFGLLNLPLSNPETMYYLNSYLFVLIISVIGATPLVSGFIKKVLHNEKGIRIINTAEPIVHVALLIIIIGYFIDGSFNPFLYFRF